MAKRPSTASSPVRRSTSLSRDGRGVGNQLLAALPPEDYARLAKDLAVVPLVLKEIIHKPGAPIDHVLFPGGGFCSELTVLADGRMVEVATIGREGMVGIGAVLEGTNVPSLTMVQASTNTCYRMQATIFRREMDRRGSFYHVVTRYSQALVGLVMQSTACNAVHLVEQRLARWLLMATIGLARIRFH